MKVHMVRSLGETMLLTDSSVTRALLRLNCVCEYRTLRSSPDAKGTLRQLLSQVVRETRQRSPGFKCSWRTIQGWDAAYAKRGLAALLDRYGRGRISRRERRTDRE